MEKIITKIVGLATNPIALTVIVVVLIAAVLYVIFRLEWDKEIKRLIKETWDGDLKIEYGNKILDKIKDDKIDIRMINVVANAIGNIPYMKYIPYWNTFIKSFLYKVSQKIYDKLKQKLNAKKG